MSGRGSCLGWGVDRSARPASEPLQRTLMGFRAALLNLKASVDARYGWWLVAIGVVVLTTAGDTLYTSLVAMLHSGLPATPRATIVWTISAIAQSGALLLPLVGMVVDRFGSRPTMVAGLSLCAVAAILAAALADTRATLVLAPALTVGMVAGTNLPVMAAINRWFHLRKALAVAAVLFAASALASTRLKLRTALLGFATLYLVALATLLLANGPGWAFAGIALLGAGHVGGTALTIAAIGEYFGRRRFATLLGTYWLVSGALQTGIFGLLFAIRPWLNYFGVSVEVPGMVGIALVPAALSAVAYWKLGDPKPAPSQIQ